MPTKPSTTVKLGASFVKSSASTDKSGVPLVVKTTTASVAELAKDTSQSAPLTDKKSKSITSLRGFKDVLPDEQGYWDKIESVVKSVASAYGFGKIRLPIAESTPLFERGVGKETDIVGKEMFTFLDQGNTRMTLRPEGTAPAVRAYIEHGMLNQPQPVKLWYLEQFFRHERPQAGRYRQFWQAGFEVIGSNDPVLDAQLIVLGVGIFKQLGIEVSTQLNSIGMPAERRQYITDLTKYFKSHSKKLGELDLKRLAKNPLRILDSKEPAVVELKKDAPNIISYLDPESKAHFMKVIEYLDAAEIQYNLDSSLVRGLDYYTRTVFEFMVPNPIEGESPITLGGGGRYDGLVELLGGRANTPGVGLAIGIERLILAVKQAKSIPASELEQPVDVFFCQLGEAARRQGLKIFEKLRASGLNLGEAFSKGSLKAQLETADKLRSPFALILGQKEVLDGTIILRDMDAGAQEILDVEKIQSVVIKRLHDLKTKSAK